MRAARVDVNQKHIVNCLRKEGYTVQHLHNVGEGCPDILVGYKGLNILMEIKDGRKPESERKLTAQQVIFHKMWKGQVEVVISPEQAILAVLAHTNGK
jgi:hypothetical protein